MDLEQKFAQHVLLAEGKSTAMDGVTKPQEALAHALLALAIAVKGLWPARPVESKSSLLTGNPPSIDR
jgi:hypothetical protein